MKYPLFIFTFILLQSFHLMGNESYNLPPRYFNASIPQAPIRMSSDPFISGDSFRFICDHHIDETKQPFFPTKVKKGDIIYVTPGALNFFFKRIHPKISQKYILLTHNSDEAFPGRFAKRLNDDTIAYWMTTNNLMPDHPKMISLPIGIANRYWPHGDVSLFEKIVKECYPKKHLLVLNFLPHTNPKIRKPLRAFYLNKPFCYCSSVKDLSAYLIDMKQSHFILSPFGNGLDCHRTWEALLMGAIPIVESSPLDCLFDGLPVLIVKNLYLLNETFLLDQKSRFSKLRFNADKIFFSYWKKLIASKKIEIIGEKD
ncbi:MAG: hypothetical protein K9M07_05115 [Simkaniaceae bacterium]|nr:hypothetical protein [Simkaniaceae bacterium]